jgi:hypothetical protein
MAWFRPFGVLSVLAMTAGCSGSSFDLAPVTGQVTINGQPFSQGRVMFAPIAQGGAKEVGKPAFGILASDGSFKLTTFEADDGAVVGEHWVTVIRIEPEGAPEPPPGPAGARKNPLAFERVVAPQKATVVAGQDNRVEIQLTRADLVKFGTFKD